MKVHYFQRYTQKENVVTSNTILLLSRLYHYSPDEFFRFLKESIFIDDNQFEPEIQFALQEKAQNTVPDATITQDSFKIVVETKLSDWFYTEQLQGHLEAFGTEKTKVLMTLAPITLAGDKINQINKAVDNYCRVHSVKIWYIHRTFRQLIDSISRIIDERDYEMQDVLSDYIDFCSEEGLLPSKAVMRMQLAGTTFDFNVKSNVYYDKVERGFRTHQYLGLYKNKSVRAIGKVCAIIRAVEENGFIRFTNEMGELTAERKQIIDKAMNDAITCGYDIRHYEYRYFFVEKFYETNFQKVSSGGCMGSRIFDLEEILDFDNNKSVPDTFLIAEELKKHSWR